MEEKIDFQKLKRQVKIKELKDGIKIKAKQAVGFMEEHRDLMVVVVPTVIGAGIKLSNMVKNNKREYNEWDPRAGRNWSLKRNLSMKEALELDRRYRNGESKGQILSDMRLLK